ncbi:MAG: VanW family protein [Clostridia bacterium]|nr:VanW family protein [Clostridia bacterium]
MPMMTRAGYTPPKADPKKPPRAQTPKKKKKKRKKGLSGAAVVSLIIFAAAALIGAGTIYVYTQTQPYLAAFAPGTMLMGYPLQGATRMDAEALIDTIAAEYVQPWQAEIVCMNQTYTITAQDIGLAVDKEATLEPLWAAAREGGMMARYAQMLRMRSEPVIMQPVLTYDLEPVDAILEIIRADVECESVDATVVFHPGSAQPFVFTDEQNGYALDTSHVKAEIERGIARLNAACVTLEPEVIEPKVYRAVLENSLSLRARLVTKLEGGEAAVTNASLAAEQLARLCVEPGAALSFNETVGVRSQERGYLTAPEPAYGPDVSGVGGGVCQTSTALYRAALLAGIEVSERSAAVRPVDYCPMGQEAAVSDQGLDLVLRNQTDAKLFITSRVYVQDDDTMLEIMIIGDELGRRYALESLIDETGTIEEPIYVRDREGRYAKYADERIPVGEALTGYTADVERIDLGEDGQEIARTIVSQNVYEAVAPTIYVGTAQRE